jgi:hypothetical protein
MANTKGRTRDVNAANRAAIALDLRAQKLTYEEIAQRCGYASRGACHDAVMRELDRRVVENVDILRREEVAMLDQLHVEVWELAMDKKNDKRLFAVDRVLSIAERRAKLMGLDQVKDSNLLTAQVVVRQVPAGYFEGQPKTVEAGS